MVLIHVRRNCVWFWEYMTTQMANTLPHLTSKMAECTRKWIHGNGDDLPLLPAQPPTHALGRGIVIPAHIYEPDNFGGLLQPPMAAVPSDVYLGGGITPTEQLTTAVTEPTTLLLFGCTLVLLICVLQYKARSSSIGQYCCHKINLTT